MYCKNPYLRSSVHDNMGLKLKLYDHVMNAMPFACGHCIPCKVNNSRIWIHRMLLEMSCWYSTVFVTLTYATHKGIKKESLNREHLTLFLKKLRKRIPQKIRYFAVGEYGEKFLGPHFHLIIFNLDESNQLEIQESWDYGFTTTEIANIARIRYIMTYMFKGWVWEEHPLLEGRTPEFSTMSRRPGIGKEGLRKIFQKMPLDEIPMDMVIREINYGSQKMPLGRYLTNILAGWRGQEEDQFHLEAYKYMSRLIDSRLLDDTRWIDQVTQRVKGKTASIEKRHKHKRNKR